MGRDSILPGRDETRNSRDKTRQSSRKYYFRDVHRDKTRLSGLENSRDDTSRDSHSRREKVETSRRDNSRPTPIGIIANASASPQRSSASSSFGSGSSSTACIECKGSCAGDCNFCPGILQFLEFSLFTNLINQMAFWTNPFRMPTWSHHNCWKQQILPKKLQTFNSWFLQKVWRWGWQIYFWQMISNL